MRHCKKKWRKLGRTKSHRIALFRNLLSSLFYWERIKTTLAKAKEIQRIAERIIGYARREGIESRRLVARWIHNRDIIRKIFEEISPRLSEHTGGYIRIFKLGERLGDAAPMAIVEILGAKREEKKMEEKKAEKKKPAIVPKRKEKIKKVEKKVEIKEEKKPEKKEEKETKKRRGLRGLLRRKKKEE